jgi:Ca2+-binding EF-hand superfamily protein
VELLDDGSERQVIAFGAHSIMLSRVLLRPLRVPTRGARNVSLSGHNKPHNMLRVPTRGARLTSRRWLRHPPGPRVDGQRSQTWDGTRIVRFGPKDPIDRKRHWSAMTEQTRAAWIELGWNARNWYDGGSDPRLGGHVPWSEKYDWHELHPSARAAAERLGYDERLWSLDDDATYNPDAPWPFVIVAALLVVFYGIQAMMTRAKWSGVGATREERELLRAYIAATTRKDKALGALSTSEVDEGANFYLDRLREVYERLADPATGRLTRASWETACRTSKSDDSSPSPAWGSAAWDADDRDVAQVLFEAADLAHDEVLSFMEFAQLAILAAAAGAGDREAQVDILFMLIDKDQNQTIEYHELERFCRNAARWGLLLDEDPQRACEEVWSDASGYGNGLMTQAQFRKVSSRFRFVDLPAPVAGAEWRELVEKHKKHYFREERDDRRYHGYARGWRGGGSYGGGGYGGGYGGRGGGCFAAGTRVVLRDGSARAIERIVVGEKLAGNSVAVATLRFDAAAAAPLFEVRGVRVTADHAVLTDGRFVRAREAAGATRAPAAADGLVYDLITTDHRIRIVANGGAELECADYLELPEGRVAYDRLLGGLNAGLAAA